MQATNCQKTCGALDKCLCNAYYILQRAISPNIKIHIKEKEKNEQWPLKNGQKHRQFTEKINAKR